MTNKGGKIKMKKKYTTKQLEDYYRRKYNKIPEETIKKFLRKKQLTVYGAKSYNAHFPTILDRHTDDYDVYGKKYKKNAKNLEKKLDKAMGGDYYYTKPAEHEGTYKVKSYVTENTVVDVSKPENNIPYKVIDGIRYQTLPYAKKRALATLKKEESKFRWPKEKEFLKRLKVYNDLVGKEPLGSDKFKWKPLPKAKPTVNKKSKGRYKSIW